MTCLTVRVTYDAHSTRHLDAETETGNTDLVCDPDIVFLRRVPLGRQHTMTATHTACPSAHEHNNHTEHHVAVNPTDAAQRIREQRHEQFLHDGLAQKSPFATP